MNFENIEHEINKLEEEVNSKSNFKYIEPTTEFDCHGYKLAYLEDVTSLNFRSLFSGVFAHDDKALCEKGHRAPDFECSCGFHSFKNLKDAIKERRWFSNTFILRVENYGEIVEHKTGWRAEDQIVKEIIIDRNCSKIFCRRFSTHISKLGNSFKNFCAYHSNKIHNSGLEVFSDDFFLNNFGISITRIDLRRKRLFNFLFPKAI